MQKCACSYQNLLLFSLCLFSFWTFAFVLHFLCQCWAFYMKNEIGMWNIWTISSRPMLLHTHLSSPGCSCLCWMQTGQRELGWGATSPYYRAEGRTNTFWQSKRWDLPLCVLCSNAEICSMLSSAPALHSTLYDTTSISDASLEHCRLEHCLAFHWTCI